ncbi:MAG: GNAT family N-acetyltransferase [Chloroflexota bacterium]|nr:MAG: hypothetical protein DLM70_06235 [Chloroflexota bacterium]
MYGPILRGQSISLEPPRREDIPLYLAWFADTQVTRTLLARFVPGEKQEEEWLERAASGEAQVFWRIVLQGRTIGGTGLHDIDWINRHASSGMFIGERAEWGKGYASETVALRTAYAFEELGLERLESESLVNNLAMHRALQKSGYREIGRRRRYIYRNGQWNDAFVFEVLRDEWEAARR